MATITQTLPRTRSWRSGAWDWITTVDHKQIAKLYLFAAAAFFAIAGLEAMLLRTQLAVPDNDVIGGNAYNQLFTMHGVSMIFLAVMPLNAGFFNLVVPLQIGARDVAFPRLNALSFWLFLFGGILLNVSFFSGAPDGGWFAYPPLTEKAFSPNTGMEHWVLGLAVLGTSSIISSINFIVTVLNLRSPGMRLTRMPLFAWMTLITSFLIIFAFPPFTVAAILLLTDRVVGTVFFDASAGGDPVLWQHMFWFMGHPEVYVLILPPMGVVSEVIPTFSRKPLFGYTAVVFSGISIGFLGFAVWAHHMFAVGLGPVANAVFTAMTMLIAIPTGVKVLNWSATLFRASIKITTPMLFAVSFVGLFTVGGLSGMMHAASPVDLQHTDTYFIVAHFHYVLFGGSVFGILAGLYYWWPKLTGRMLSEGWGKIHWFLMFVGFNLTFAPMHMLGNDGMPRRVYTYAAGQGWDGWNLVATAGSYLTAAGFLLFVFIVLKGMRGRQEAADDPWDGATLEWATASPPAEHNFDVIPTVGSNRPVWDAKYEGADAPVKPATGAVHIHMPPSSYWPIVVAAGLALGAVGVIYFVPLSIVGLLITFYAIFAWTQEPTEVGAR
ncbi:MAG: cytochrome c oxidase subunit I [Chloroflexota bacterium]|nr:cytochrome c oxidase subunit I [Chloroflexota bacterium]MDP6758721.1 cytochrome c oxidase subunit I [Chloroflexota bacterium]